MTVLYCCRSRPHVYNSGAATHANARQLASSLPFPRVSEIHPSPTSQDRPVGPRLEAGGSLKPVGIIDAIPIQATHTGPIDLEQLEIDDSDGADDHVPLSKRASVTWTAVCNRLTRHISLEGTFKKQTPSLTGHSQEEIARRAELKRLMHRRIQDELLCDDDLPDACSEAQKTVHKPSVSNLGQSRGGPRDTIEFIVNKKDHTQTSSESENVNLTDRKGLGFFAESVIPEHAPAKDQVITTASSPGCGRYSREADTTGKEEMADNIHNATEFRGSPDNCDDIMKTSRPSRAHQAKSDSRDSQSWETHSILAMWLRSQSTRSREPSFAYLDDSEPNQSISDKHKEPYSDDVVKPHASPRCNSDFGQRPGALLSAEVQGENSPGTCPTTTTLPPQVSVSNEQQASKDSVPKVFPLSPSEDLAQSYAVAMAFDDKVEAAASSAYPSVIPSIQTSPMTSQTNIFYNLNSRDLHSIQLSSLPWNKEQPGASSKIVQHSREGSGTTVKRVEESLQEFDSHRSQLTLDNVSVAPTESASFRQREVELNSIQKRFGGAVPRKKAPTIVRSRFREEFNPPLRPSSRRGTLMARVHRSFERRSKTRSGSTDDARMAPMTSSSGGMLQQTAPTGVTEANVNAGLAAAVPSAMRRTRLPVARNRPSNMITSAPSESPMPLARIDASLPLASQSSKETSTAVVDNRSYSVERKTSLTRHDSLAPTMRNGRLVIHSGTSDYGKHVEAPPSWTRFSSETRNERNGSATFGRDSVHTHDFAFDAVGSSALRSRRVSTPTTSRIPVSRSIKLGRRVKSGISRMLPFFSHDGGIRAEGGALPEGVLHSARSPEQIVPGDMAASMNGSLRSSSISVDLSPPPTVPSSSDFPGEENWHPVEFEVSGDNNSATTVHRLSPMKNMMGSQELAHTSGLELSDVFLTPLCGSLATESSGALEVLVTRSRTCPNMSQHVIGHKVQEHLPMSHSCPACLSRTEVDDVHEMSPTLHAKEGRV